MFRIAAVSFLFGFVTSLVVGQTPSSPKEKVVTEVQGRDVDFWVGEIKSKDPSRRGFAIQNTLKFGAEPWSKALPVVLAELKKHSATTPVDVSVRLHGTTALGVYLAKEKPDPKLLKEGMLILKTMLKDSQAIVRHRAVTALGQIGYEARPMISDVMEMVSDKQSWEIRQAAIHTLVYLGADPKIGPPVGMLPAFYKGLSDSTYQVRMSSAQALGMLGVPLDPVIKATMFQRLETAAKSDPDPQVQITAHVSLVIAKGTTAPENIGPIVKSLSHKDPTIRAYSAMGLGFLGSRAKGTADVLAGRLSDSDTSVRVAVVTALGKVGATDTLSQLEKIAEDSSSDDELKTAAKDAVKLLRKRLKE